MYPEPNTTMESVGLNQTWSSSISYKLRQDRRSTETKIAKKEILSLFGAQGVQITFRLRMSVCKSTMCSPKFYPILCQLILFYSGVMEISLCVRVRACACARARVCVCVCVKPQSAEPNCTSTFELGPANEILVRIHIAIVQTNDHAEVSSEDIEF